MQTIDDSYLTVAEAATLLRVAPSTIRRWIRQGDVPAYRMGRRRVTLKRTDLDSLVTPARAGEKTGYRTIHVDDPSEIPKLTPEEVQRGIEAMEHAQRTSKRILARRGGKPFPPSWEFINEMRDERTRQLG